MPFDCTTELIPEADISGRGVRLSFYIQGACLVISAAYSRPEWRMTGTAAPYAVTGLIYAVCTLALGFIPEPEITLYDAVISTSLSGISLLSVIALMLIYTLKHNVDSTVMLSLVCGQAFCLLVSATLVSIAIPNFGLHPECFEEIYHIFLGKISIRKFRTITLIFYSVFLVAFVAFLSYTVTKWYLKRKAHRIPTIDDTTDTAIDKHNRRLLTAVLVIFSILYAFAIAYVEVLRSFNRTLIADPEGWNFGQIVAFGLCVVPVMDTIHVLKQHWKDRGCFHLTHSRDVPLPLAHARDQSSGSAQLEHLLHERTRSDNSMNSKYTTYKAYRDNLKA
ncbi:hypothetical protein AX16_006197 [Volvariella volvacea WC 439]|nr:hypothetical protein AX16_006197 [Volvariella volvacea WC 439]